MFFSHRKPSSEFPTVFQQKFSGIFFNIQSNRFFLHHWKNVFSFASTKTCNINRRLDRAYFGTKEKGVKVFHFFTHPFRSIFCLNFTCSKLLHLSFSRFQMRNAGWSSSTSCCFDFKLNAIAREGTWRVVSEICISGSCLT